MTRLLRMSYFASEDSNKPRSLELTWDQLATQLQAPTTAPCSIAPGTTTCVGSKCPYKLGQAWSPAAYPPGLTRSKKNVAAVSVLVIDLDHMTDAQLAAVAIKLQPYKYIVHATHSDREGDRCLRAAIALNAPVAGIDWSRFWLQAVTELDLPIAIKRDETGGIDKPTRDASRLFFLPSRPFDGGFLSATNDGSELDVAAILARAPVEAAPDPLALPNAVSVVPPDVMQAAALDLAAAWPAKGRHYAFLALAGALAMHGWPEEAITDLTTRVARFMPNSDEKAIADRPLQAASSVAMVLRGEHVTGWGTLAAEHIDPAVVDRVRERLGMQSSFDAASAALAGLFDVAETPAPTAQAESYPSASALDNVFATYQATQPQAVPEVAAEPGTFLAYLQEARAQVTAAVGNKDLKTNAGAGRPLFMSARDLFRMEFPPTPWLIERLITAGGVAGIIAEPKSAKSWLALSLALSAASGTNALGKYRVPTAVPTAYFFAEDLGPSIRNRIGAFAAGLGMRGEDLAANLHVQPRGEHLDLTKDEDVARIIASCRAIGNIRFLILDPLRDIHTGAENESDDMSAVFARLRLIGTALDGATVLVVHHAKRANKDKDQDENRPGSDARGSSAIEGALDSIISLRDLRGNAEDGEITNTVVTQIKNAKSAGTFPLTLKIRDDANGQSEHATWAIGNEAHAPKVEASTFDQLVIAALEHMMAAEIRKDRAQSTDHIRKATKKSFDLVSAAMIQAERDGFVLKHIVGKKHVGWILTEMGRAHVRAAAEAPTYTAEPAAPPAPSSPAAEPPAPGTFGIASMLGIANPPSA